MLGTATLHTLPSTCSQPVTGSEPLITTCSPAAAGVGDAALVAEPAVPRPDPLAVLAAVDDDGVPGLGQCRGPADGPERVLLGPVGVIRPSWCNVEFGWHLLHRPFLCQRFRTEIFPTFWS